MTEDICVDSVSAAQLCTQRLYDFVSVNYGLAATECKVVFVQLHTLGHTFNGHHDAFWTILRHLARQRDTANFYTAIVCSTSIFVYCSLAGHKPSDSEYESRQCAWPCVYLNRIENLYWCDCARVQWNLIEKVPHHNTRPMGNGFSGLVFDWWDALLMFVFH